MYLRRDERDVHQVVKTSQLSLGLSHKLPPDNVVSGFNFHVDLTILKVDNAIDLFAALGSHVCRWLSDGGHIVFIGHH